MKFKIGVGLLVLISAHSNKSFSQDNDTFLLSGSIGLGVPLGSFASKNTSTTKSGYAKSGLSTAFSLSGTPKKSQLGFVASFNSNSFNYDFGPVGKKLSQSSGFDIVGLGDKWKTRSLLVGCFYTFREERLTSFQVGALIGVLTIKKKEWTYVGRNILGQRDQFFYVDKKARKPAFSFFFKMQRKLSERLCYTLNLGLLISKPTIDYTVEFESVTRPDYSDSGSFEQPIAALTFDLGIYYRLSK